MGVSPPFCYISRCFFSGIQRDTLYPIVFIHRKKRYCTLHGSCISLSWHRTRRLKQGWRNCLDGNSICYRPVLISRISYCLKKDVSSFTIIMQDSLEKLLCFFEKPQNKIWRQKPGATDLLNRVHQTSVCFVPPHTLSWISSFTLKYARQSGKTVMVFWITQHLSANSFLRYYYASSTLKSVAFYFSEKPFFLCTKNREKN